MLGGDYKLSFWFPSLSRQRQPDSADLNRANTLTYTSLSSIEMHRWCDIADRQTICTRLGNEREPFLPFFWHNEYFSWDLAEPMVDANHRIGRKPALDMLDVFGSLSHEPDVASLCWSATGHVFRSVDLFYSSQALHHYLYYDCARIRVRVGNFHIKKPIHCNWRDPASFCLTNASATSIMRGWLVTDSFPAHGHDGASSKLFFDGSKRISYYH
jgi:hypothetical protein